MCHNQCDRRPCYSCGRQYGDTKGPGGVGCPAEGKLTTRQEVDIILTAYMGRTPGLEALDFLLPQNR